MMELVELLENLCAAPGIAGAENGASQLALQYLKRHANTAYIDDFNNVIGIIRKPLEGEKTVLLDAHIDEIGMIVTSIDRQGFLRVANCGGVDRRLLLGQQVTIYAKEPVPGIVATLPPHLTGSDDRKVPEAEEILIDIGRNKEEAEKIVRPGDRVAINSVFHKLLGNRVSSRALDDRSGVAAILMALEQIRGKTLSCGVSVLFSAQEETGERGAAIAGYALDPDIAISIDVSFAHTPDAPEHRCGKMGNGVMIGIAPTLNRDISDRFVKLAQAVEIPYQLEVMGGTTGTNADTIGIQRGGIQTGLLSIPQKYMHTPIEMIDLKDLKAVSNLLAAYLLTFGKDGEIK